MLLRNPSVSVVSVNSWKNFRLDEDTSWDWHKFVKSLPDIKEFVLSIAEILQSELYLWLEFGENESENQYYVITQNNLYWRGGFKPIEWDELEKFVVKPRPQAWGGVFLAKSFTLDECTPHLDEAKLIDVFKAMRHVRDIWRGTEPL